MNVKRVAGAIGAELQAINLADGIDGELAATLRALLMSTRCCFCVIRPSAPPTKRR